MKKKKEKKNKENQKRNMKLPQHTQCKKEIEKKKMKVLEIAIRRKS